MDRKFNVIRIPIKYTKQIDILTEKQQLFIYKSLGALGRGEKIKERESMEFYILCNIFEEWMSMESKNGNKSEKSLTKYLSELPAQGTTSNSETTVQYSTVQDNTVQDSTAIVETKVSTLQNYIKEEFTNEFISDIYNKHQLSKEQFKESCEDFVGHWTEKSPNGKKEKWQMEKTFDPKLRFGARIKRSNKWNKPSFPKKGTGITTI